MDDIVILGSAKTRSLTGHHVMIVQEHCLFVSGQLRLLASDRLVKITRFIF